EALLTLRKTVTNLLLASLSNHCADLYGIHDHMQTLLGDEQYQECHHVLLLLYAACRESTPISAALVACHGELLIPYMWGAMQALENYLQSQDELYRRREDAHV
ncbi:MAG: hypothetical protein RSC06_14890, partial [Clostridia bacterium]